ncbi:amino acid ABC transporter permease [Sodalis sp. RH24]|uniref:amino acid ABC transporter permease n=1 Tax=unclassified Sodalis (in: enterobacteria) TaxID=2636512 RepID=UPI003965C9B1
MHIDFTVLYPYWPLLLQGAGLTLKITLIAFAIGYLLGMAVALLGLVPLRVVAAPIGLYIACLRSAPFIIFLFVVYYGLPYTGLRLPAEVVGTLALALYASAYYGEILRAGIQALPRGQFESARAIGMSPAQAMRHIIAPQVLRAVVPPTTNMTLTMMKESAVLSSITVPELTYQGLVVQGATFAPFEVFIAITALYWLIAALVAEIARRVELGGGQPSRHAIQRSAIARRYLSLDWRNMP